MMIGIHALQNIAVAQERLKKYFDAKHCKDIAKYWIGALVLLKNTRKVGIKLTG